MGSFDALGLSAPSAMALGALLALAGTFLILRASALWRAYRLRARFENAAEGELRARGYLEELGYEVLGAQVGTEYTLRVDEREVPVRLRADYIVARAGKRFVAEVKTGGAATQIETAATRRQLLEYRLAFEVDGVLLVDADRKRVSTIVFPSLASPTRTHLRPAISFALVCTAALAAAVLAFLAR